MFSCQCWFFNSKKYFIQWWSKVWNNYDVDYSVVSSIIIGQFELNFAQIFSHWTEFLSSFIQIGSRNWAYQGCIQNHKCSKLLTTTTWLEKYFYLIRYPRKLLLAHWHCPFLHLPKLQLQGTWNSPNFGMKPEFLLDFFQEHFWYLQFETHFDSDRWLHNGMRLLSRRLFVLRRADERTLYYVQQSENYRKFINWKKRKITSWPFAFLRFCSNSSMHL